MRCAGGWGLGDRGPARRLAESSRVVVRRASADPDAGWEVRSIYVVLLQSGLARVFVAANGVWEWSALQLVAVCCEMEMQVQATGGSLATLTGSRGRSVRVLSSSPPSV